MDIPILSQKFKTNIVGGDYLENTISTTVNYIGDAVSTSYGPYGSHSILLVNGQPKPTKDGLKIIENMRMSGNISQTILHLVHSIALSQNSENGDGSTTMTLLFRELYNSFSRYLKTNNLAPSMLKNATEHVVNDIIIPNIDKLANKDLTDDDIYALIYTSVDGDESLAKTIASLFAELNSTDPLIQLRFSETKEHRYELVDGVTLDANIIFGETVLNYSNQRNMTNPLVMIVDGQFKMPVNHFVDLANELYDFNIASVRDGAAESNLLIICSGVTEEIFSTVSMISKSNPELFRNIVFLQYKHLAKRDYLKDVSVLLNCKIISEDMIKNYDADTNGSTIKFVSTLVGLVGKAVIREYSTQFTNLDIDENTAKNRIDEINEMILRLKDDPGASNNTIEELEERLSMLRKNCAVLYIGGNSIERKNINYELAKDAVPQVLSAYKHGVLQGMNKGIIQILINCVESSEEIKHSVIYNDIIRMIISAYRTLSIRILQNKNPMAKIFDIESLVDDMMLNRDGNNQVNIRELSDVKVLGSANTDKVVIKNATDMAILLCTSKLLLTTFEEHDLMELNK